MLLKQCEDGTWIDLLQDSILWRAFVVTVMNIWVPWHLDIREFNLMPLITVYQGVARLRGDSLEECIC
jgi:hypothetical protein